MALIIQLIIIIAMLATGVLMALQHYRSLNVLVLGAGSTAAKVLQDIENDGHSHRYNLLGFVKSQSNEDSIAPKLRFDSELSLLHLAKRVNANAVVIAVDQRVSHEWIQPLLDCKLGGIKVIDASALSFQHKNSPALNKGILRTPGQV